MGLILRASGGLDVENNNRAELRFGFRGPVVRLLDENTFLSSNLRAKAYLKVSTIFLPTSREPKMNLTRPLFYLAVAAAMVSSFATQACAQSAESVLACEQFNAAVAEKEGAFVVSGIQAEETVEVEVPDFAVPSNFEFTTFLIRTSEFAFDTTELTLPSGTLTQQCTDEAFEFRAGRAFTFLAQDINGNASEVILGTSGQGCVFSLVPDPALGTAYGFCVTSVFPEMVFEASFFDGDTLIGQASGSDGSFFAQPGETITRIEFVALAIFDIQVAFCTDTPPEDADEIVASVIESLIDLGDVADKDVVNAIKSLGQAEKQLDRGNENSACAHINNAIRRIERSDLSDAEIDELVAELEQAKALVTQ